VYSSNFKKTLKKAGNLSGSSNICTVKTGIFPGMEGEIIYYFPGPGKFPRHSWEISMTFLGNLYDIPGKFPGLKSIRLPYRTSTNHH